MIEEVVPDLHHWSAHHEGIRQPVHSAYHEPSGTLVDPMAPEQGLDWFAEHGPPQRIVLTNRHHYRHSDRFRERWELPVLCHRAGLHEFGPDRPVEGFDFGQRIAPGVTALELGAITPEEAVLHIEAGPGVLAFADGLIRRDDALGFVPDSLLGDDPEAVKQGLRAGLRNLLDQHFDALLFGHGAPLPADGRRALEAFLLL